MPVRVAQEELPGAVRPLLAREMFHAPATEVTLPGIEVIHAQGEVIAPMVGRDRLGALADNVKFLARAEPEPRARKGKRGSRDGLELQGLPIKPATFFNVADVNSDMVQFVNSHQPTGGSRLRSARADLPRRSSAIANIVRFV